MADEDSRTNSYLNRGSIFAQFKPETLFLQFEEKQIFHLLDLTQITDLVYLAPLENNIFVL